MSDSGIPSTARVALCNRMGLRSARADPTELDATISVICAPVAAALLRHLSLAIDSPGDLLLWAREIDRNPAALRDALAAHPTTAPNGATTTDEEDR